MKMDYATTRRSTIIDTPKKKDLGQSNYLKL